VYNSANETDGGDSADGSVQLLADQSGGVRVGRGLETPSVLPPQWTTSLREYGERVGILFGTRFAIRQMRPFSSGASCSSESNRKFTRNLAVHLFWTRQSSDF